MRKKRKNALLLLFFLIISFLEIIFIYIANDHQLPMGQDSEFHMARVLGLSNVFQSPVNFNAFGHQGNIMNIMYPWQTLYPAYLLYRITGNFTASMYIFYYLLTLATLFISFYTMNAIRREYFSSIIFALVYTFSSYRLTNLVFRSALGEYVAMTFLPLVLLGCYKILCDDYEKYYILSIGMCLIAWSHLLSVAMSNLLLNYRKRQNTLEGTYTCFSKSSTSYINALCRSVSSYCVPASLSGTLFSTHFSFCTIKDERASGKCCFVKTIYVYSGKHYTCRNYPCHFSYQED